MDFENKVVIIAGGVDELASAHAHYLCDLGATVVVNDIDAGRAELLVKDLVAKGGESLAVVGCLSEADVAKQLVNTTLKTFGRLDVLINNSDKNVQGDLSDFDDDKITSILNRSLLSTIRVTKAVLPHMIGTGYGRIVNTTSGVGVFGAAGNAVYSAVSSAVIGFTRSVSLEVQEIDISVNVISPLTDSRCFSAALDDSSFSDFSRYRPELISPTVAYLCHKKCHISGELISVGGGRVARIFTSAVPGYFNEEASIDDIANNTDAILARDHAVVPLRASDEFLFVDV